MKQTARSEAAGRFKAAVCAKPCYWWEPDRELCDGPLDACHLVPAQRLRTMTRHLPEWARLEVIYSPKLALCGCRADHHKLDNGFLYLYREDIPGAFDEARNLDEAYALNIEYQLQITYPSFEELQEAGL